MFYRVSRWLLRCGLTALGGLKSVGSEKIPETGGVIIAPNHISNVDPPAVGCGMRRPLRFMAKEELFKPRLLGAWIRGVGGFPVKRGTADRKAIKHAIELLAEGEAVCIFPEGTRSPDGKLQDPELGIGLIALKSRAPIVPVALIGTDRVLTPGGKGVHRHAMKIVYGEPIICSDLFEEKESRQAMEEIGRRVMAGIAALCPELHRS